MQAFVVSVIVLLLAPNVSVAKGKTRVQGYLSFASRLFRDGDFEGALLQLRRAEPMLQGHKKRPLVLFNIARCLEEMGQNADALRAYETFLDSPGSDARQARARAKIARLLPLATGRIDIRCDPKGARLRIEGLEGSYHCPWISPRLVAGAYTVHGTRRGYEPRTIAAVVSPGRQTVHRLVLPKLRGGAMVDAGPAPASDSTPWMVGGAGVALIGVGVLLHLSARSTRDEANRVEPGARFDALESSYKNRELAAFGAYAVGGGALALGAWWLGQDASGGRP